MCVLSIYLLGPQKPSENVDHCLRFSRILFTWHFIKKLKLVRNEKDL